MGDVSGRFLKIWIHGYSPGLDVPDSGFIVEGLVPAKDNMGRMLMSPRGPR
jgi:hypothetical protein